MAKKKILYLVTQSELGGAQEYICTLAANLDKNLYEPLIMAGDGYGEFFKALASQNLPFKGLKLVKRSINPVFDLLGLFELIFAIKQERPYVIHLNSSKIGFLGALAEKLCGHQVKIIYTAHGWVFNEPLHYLIKKLYFWIEKISASWKDTIICVCEADRQIALKNKFKTEIITIHNAVNPGQLEFLAKDEAINFLKLNTGDLVIGTIANFYKTKGLNYLIESVGILKNDFPKIKAVIIGEGEERKNMEALIRRLNLSANVILTGAIPAAHRYLKAFDLFILPSVKEGMPYVVLKAMAANLPIVATRVGGLPEILPPECLIEPGNAAIMAEKIKYVLAGRLDLPAYNLESFQKFLQKTVSLY